MRLRCFTLAVVSLLCLGTTSFPASRLSNADKPLRRTWVDSPVRFAVDGLIVFGTYRHSSTGSALLPAVLLIAGSGPTDRNGNSGVAAGPIDTLRTLADWLSADGVASLRYDKLGSGETGLGPFASRVSDIGVAPFLAEARAGLAFLARQHFVDRRRLGVFGHSEGALFALLVAITRPRSPLVPTIRAIGLLEPLSVRYLDVISAQLDARALMQRHLGLISASQLEDFRRTVAQLVGSVRSGVPIPALLPFGLSTTFNSSDEIFLSQADRLDPSVLAARLDPAKAVLVTCSNRDLQVTCAEVDHVVTGAVRSGATVDFLHLSGVDHVLKEDPTGAAVDYTAPLPFSGQARRAIAAFVRRYL